MTISISSFNKQVIKEEAFEAFELLRAEISNNIESSIVFDICRETYLLSYNAELLKHGGQFQQGITNSSITEYANKVKEFSSKWNIEPRQVLNIAEKYYLKTASHDESKSKTYLDDTNAGPLSPGKYYNFNVIPNWEDLETKVLNEIESL